ncbi:neuropeptide FF receptor 2 [Daphnia magna]|uniref:2-oxoglutarate receptor 1 n=1 Tax=Daphnia magna TaxID=35525 RepID=A0A0P5DRW7_9CRUS|nr:neuropeptide FF receptor 2 [Daphnia magna]XP_032792759.1 neuropeptide FF receptor 2 [Daphnia magna]KZS19306.1 2-oxoglutarate receptor 1 [Daphnia magna]
MDFSNINFPFPLWIVRPTWECALKIGFFVPVIIVSLVGNGLVIYLMATNRFLRTSINIFIWNLAIADLLTILLFPWIILIIDLYQMFILGAVICQIEGFLRVMLMLVDVFSLLAVSCDRFFAIVFPFRPRMGHLAAYIICGVIWILSSAIACPLITARVYKERQWKDILESWCIDNVSFSFIYYISLDAILVWFPLIVMTVLFIFIFIIMKQRTSTCSAIQLKQLAQRHRIIRMLFFILIGFFICYMPFTISIIVRNKVVLGNSINSIPDWLRSLLYTSRYVMCVNTALNPIIYGFCNDNFRKAAAKQFPSLKWGVTPVASAMSASSNNGRINSD